MRGKRAETHSVRQQGKDILAAAFRRGYGQSKHDLKRTKGGIEDKVFCDSTYQNYLTNWHRFCDSMAKDGFAVHGHKPRTLEEAAQYMPQYIEKLKKSPGSKAGTLMSAWTIRTYFAAPAKVLGLKAGDYDLPTRKRSDIRRSRGEAVRDKDFSPEAHAELIEFCRCTGLRNHKELQAVRGTDLIIREDGRYAIHVRQGKGGKARDAVIWGSPEEIRRVVERMKAAGNDLVWPRIPDKLDVHHYRAEYAQRMYAALARDPASLPPAERYCCRGDMKGVWFDRKAMLQVSRELGHERVNVIAEHYLYGAVVEQEEKK